VRLVAFLLPFGLPRGSVKTHLLLVFPLLLVATGCAKNETGDYRLDDVILFSASCAAGTDSARGQTWTAAMGAAVLEDMAVSRGGALSSRPSQARFTRADGTILFADVEEGADRVFGGTRSLEATTIPDSLLGTDFSALLEADEIGCEFDLDTQIDFDFGEDGWDVVTGSVVVTVSETQALTDVRCELSTCTAEWTFAGVHQGGTGGDRVGDAPDEE